VARAGLALLAGVPPWFFSKQRGPRERKVTKRKWKGRIMIIMIVYYYHYDDDGDYYYSNDDDDDDGDDGDGDDDDDDDDDDDGDDSPHIRKHFPRPHKGTMNHWFPLISKALLGPYFLAGVAVGGSP